MTSAPRPKPQSPGFQPVELIQVDEANFKAKLKNSGPNTVVTSKSLPLESSLELLIENKTNHLCVEDAGYFPQEVASATTILANPNCFFSDTVRTILAPGTKDSIETLSYSFNKAVEKNLILDSVRENLEFKSKSGTLISDVCLCIDELFTNAIYNAPFVDLETGLNPGIDRQDYSISMPAHKSGQLNLGFSEDRLVVICKDPFGSLVMLPFLQRLKECHSKGVSNTIRHGVGGAGIGTYMVLQAASSLYIGVNHAKETVLAAVFNWKWSGRMRAKASKNLHCITTKE